MIHIQMQQLCDAIKDNSTEIQPAPGQPHVLQISKDLLVDQISSICDISHYEALQMIQ